MACLLYFFDDGIVKKDKAAKDISNKNGGN